MDGVQGYFVVKQFTSRVLTNSIAQQVEGLYKAGYSWFAFDPARPVPGWIGPPKTVPCVPSSPSNTIIAAGLGRGSGCRASFLIASGRQLREGSF